MTTNHFEDLTFVRAYDEDSNLEKLVVYTESENDKTKLLVRHVGYTILIFSSSVDLCRRSVGCVNAYLL